MEELIWGDAEADEGELEAFLVRKGELREEGVIAAGEFGNASSGRDMEGLTGEHLVESGELDAEFEIQDIISRGG